MWDAKIDSLYEGTTAIQAQDFVLRHVIRDDGETLGHLLTQIEQFCDSGTSHDQLAAGRARLTHEGHGRQHRRIRPNLHPRPR